VKNPHIGFVCLHYSVSEGAGYLLAKIQNKKSSPYTCGVRTVDGEAKSPDDYDSVDQKLEFEDGKGSFELKIKVKDDDEWEPDKDFFIELYDLESGKRLQGEDTRCAVTIIDDDRPGVLAFESAILKQDASESKCKIVVKRLHDTDGQISVRYRTI
jgi:solute carrier family 8 (sodium/calcium exchanger)